MLELLRANHHDTIILTTEFIHDLRWFSKFLSVYNGVSIYNHRTFDTTAELDACLTGLGACWKNYVYTFPIPKGYLNLTIVHLEMLNVLLALRAFGPYWYRCKILVKCDTHTVVQVLTNNKAKGAFLGSCARNVWYTAALYDMESVYVHIMGKNNVVAEILSRWLGPPKQIKILNDSVQNPLWLSISGHVASRQ